MQNPAFWARVGLLWCLFLFAACWCASTKATAPNFSGSPVDHSVAVLGATSNPNATNIVVANSQTIAPRAAGTNGAVAYAIPTLDGSGLFVLAALLGLAVLWFRRRRE